MKIKDLNTESQVTLATAYLEAWKAREDSYSYPYTDGRAGRYAKGVPEAVEETCGEGTAIAVLVSVWFAGGFYNEVLSWAKKVITDHGSADQKARYASIDA